MICKLLILLSFCCNFVFYSNYFVINKQKKFVYLKNITFVIIKVVRILPKSTLRRRAIGTKGLLVNNTI